MKHYASTAFWQCFKFLPAKIQVLARKNYGILKENPYHPSLHYKLVCSGHYRSIRVGLHYRALGIPVSTGVQWFWIGSHSDYDKLLG